MGGLTVEQAMAQWMADPETREWIESRPERVRATIHRIPPGTWWKMADGVGIYTPMAYDEGLDGTVTLTVQKHDHLMGVGYGVFGVKPEDLTWTPLTPDDPLEAFL